MLLLAELLQRLLLISESLNLTVHRLQPFRPSPCNLLGRDDFGLKNLLLIFCWHCHLPQLGDNLNDVCRKLRFCLQDVFHLLVDDFSYILQLLLSSFLCLLLWFRLKRAMNSPHCCLSSQPPSHRPSIGNVALQSNPHCIIDGFNGLLEDVLCDSWRFSFFLNPVAMIFCGWTQVSDLLNCRFKRSSPPGAFLDSHFLEELRPVWGDVFSDAPVDLIHMSQRPWPV